MGLERAHDDLVAALRARDDADAAVAPAMRSQVLRGRAGAGAIVLLHGLTASPPAWRAVAEALHARGRTVVVPRLHLHGHADRLTDALRDLDAATLIADTAAIVAAVSALGEEITVAGHSLGATLAVEAAASTAVARAVAVAPFLGIANVPHEVHGLLLGAMAPLRGRFLWWDPRLRERQQPEHGYPRYPLQALIAGVSIADGVRGGAHRAPRARAIDIVLNTGESSVNNRTAQRLAADWRRAGAAVTVHHLRGLGWSHDIIEPDRPASRRALEPLLAIIDAAYQPR
jgi:alpha-beta hydrolase superfamily lysophospholipase